MQKFTRNLQNEKVRIKAYFITNAVLFYGDSVLLFLNK